MYPDGLGNLAWILFALNLIWLSFLTFWVWREQHFLKQLFPSSPIGKRGLQRKLEEVLEEFVGLGEFKKESSKHLQKIALKRYNPYHDTGGDQSFSAALLDGKGDGLVITSLHSRAGTRVFAKPIKGGRQSSFELSEEEKAVIEEAVKIKSQSDINQ